MSTTVSTTTAFGRPTTTAARVLTIRKRRTIKTTPTSTRATTRRPTTSRTTARLESKDRHKIATWIPLRWETPVWKSTTKKPYYSKVYKYHELIKNLMKS